MATTLYYETAPMPQTDGTNVVVDSNGNLNLGSDITTKVGYLDNATSDKDKVLTANGDGTSSWKAATGGVSPSDIIKTVEGIETAANDNKIPSAYATRIYSNLYTERIIAPKTYSAGAIGAGDWDDTVSKIDWISSAGLIVNEAEEDVDVKFLFEVTGPDSQPVYIGGYRWDTTAGKMCIKFGAPLLAPTRVAIDITRMRKG